ncbi:ALG-5 protein [Aphelenchoides avenae]|nr:ALG-5 protein [Aphelenchus avenae]
MGAASALCHPTRDTRICSRGTLGPLHTEEDELFFDGIAHFRPRTVVPGRVEHFGRLRAGARRSDVQKELHANYGCDLLLRKSQPSKRLTLDEIGEKLNDVVTAGADVREHQDVFMRYHETHVSRRLILELVADQDKEEKLVNKFREVGMPAHHVNKLFRTQDIEVNKDLNLSLKKPISAINNYHHQSSSITTTTWLVSPNMLAVWSDVTSMKGVKEYFVVADQRIPLEKMHTELSQMLIKENAVLPQQRKAKVMQHAEALQLFNPDNPVLKGFGVTMEKDSHKLAIGVRKLPKIKMDDGKIVAPDVCKPAKIGNMVVLYQFGRERYRHSMRQFMKISEKRAREKGIELGNRGDKRSVKMEVDPWEKQVEQGPSQRKDEESQWHGTLGFSVPLIANYFKPHGIQPRSIVEYRVKIIVGARGQRKCTVRQECRTYFWRAVFDPAHQHIFLSQNQLVYNDYSALFSAEPLRNPDTGRPMVDGESFVLRYEYKEEERDIPIVLTVQRTNSVYIGPPLSESALQFLTLMITQHARRPLFDAELKFIPRAETWFGQNNRLYVLPYEGGNVWPITPATTLLRGLRCAVRPNSLDPHGMPILNVSLVHSLFAKANFWLIDVYAIMRGEKPLTEDERSEMRDWSMDSVQTSQLEDELKGMVLRTTYGPKRDYKLLSIDRRNPGERRFRTLVYGDVTAQEFYRAHHDITLKFPCLPLFRMHPEEQKVYIPMELLTISGKVQRIVKKLQSSFVGRAATMKPAEHFRAIENLASRADVMTSTTENAFGVSFGPPEEIQMMRVNGRVLPFPQCMFTLNTREMATQCVPDTTSKPVVVGLVPVGSISLALCANAVRQLITMSRERGITFREANPRLYPYNDVAPYNDLDAFLSAVSSDVFVAPGHTRTPNAYEKHEISFLLVFCVREENSDLHDKVKAYCEMAELGFGLETQFILEKTLRKMTTREGGRGHLATIGSLKFINEKDPTLFIGIDVAHPCRKEPTLESVAAITSNIDIQSTRFAGNIAIQRRQRAEIPRGENVEQVENLEAMTFDAIRTFYKETGHMPQHIVVLRDGVGDSQMEATSRIELGLIGDACRRFRTTYKKPNFKPTTSYVVVQKRNPTRVMPADPRSLDNFEGPYYGRNTTGNVPPGTVVDDSITTNKYPNFYLCSHKGQQGTSRIAHYTIVHSTWNALNMDDWQVSTFMLCHLVARSMTTVSVPAPVYYADILCGRARKHIAAMREICEGEYSSDKVKIIDCMRKDQFFL